MVYLCRQPSAHLSEFVKDYLLIHFDFCSNEKTPIKPYPACPKQGIIFYVRGSVISVNSLTGIAEKRAQSVVFGQPVIRQDLHLSKDYLAISVRFQPGALHKFLKTSMFDFIQKNVDAELVMGAEIRTLNEQLINAESFEVMLALIEKYLWKRIQQVKENILPIDKIGRLIYENPQKFRLDELAREACLSASQLERKFLQQIGVTPKLYARICRFYKAYLVKQRIPTLPWLDIAWEMGYNDYQHMVRDFKEFSNCAPNRLIQENSTSPEQLLLLNPDFRCD